MKNFTAVQNTESIKGMQYSFKAENLEDAIQKAPKLLSGEIVEVYETDDLGERISTELKTISFEQLAEKLNGKLWTKGDLKRIYLDRGYNTKKMSTKTYVYQREDGSFGVSCYIDCPSQTYAWIKSQQEEVIESVEKSIEVAIFNIENPDLDYYEVQEENEAAAERAEAIKDFTENIESRKEGWTRDYERAFKIIADRKAQQDRFDAMTDEEKAQKEALEEERKSILGQSGTAKRSKELKLLIEAFPSAPSPLSSWQEWVTEAVAFNDVESYVEFRLNKAKVELGINE